MCSSSFFIVIKYCDQGKSEKEEFICAYCDGVGWREVRQQLGGHRHMRTPSRRGQATHFDSLNPVMHFLQQALPHKERLHTLHKQYQQPETEQVFK